MLNCINYCQTLNFEQGVGFFFCCSAMLLTMVCKGYMLNLVITSSSWFWHMFLNWQVAGQQWNQALEVTASPGEYLWQFYTDHNMEHMWNTTVMYRSWMEFGFPSQTDIYVFQWARVKLYCLWIWDIETKIMLQEFLILDKKMHLVSFGLYKFRLINNFNTLYSTLYNHSICNFKHRSNNRLFSEQIKSFTF